MKANQLKRKVILIILIISMLVPYVPVYMPVAKATATQEFAYNGGIQEYRIGTSGTYKLEVWAGSGGYDIDSIGQGDNDPVHYGSAGGYSYGEVKLKKGDILYIGVGGQGKDCDYVRYDPNSGGYNGGGGSEKHGKDGDRDTYEGGGGGGATHIALNKNLGVLANYKDDKQSVLIVAGGGAGASTGGNWYENGEPGKVRNRSIAPGGGLECRKTTYYAECGKPDWDDEGCKFPEGNRAVGETTAGQTSSANEEDFGRATAPASGGGWYGGTSYFYVIGGTPGSGYIGGLSNAGSVEGQNRGNGKAAVTLIQADSQILTVNPNGGIYNNTTQNTSYTLEVGIPTQIPNPTRTGYRFTGWSLTGTGASINGTTFIIGTTAATLTANWEKMNYNLQVNPNGGTWNGSANIQNFTIAYEENKIISNPTRYGYKFDGWALVGNGSTISGTNFRMGYQNTTLTANWGLITHNIVGTETYNDQNNKYSSRPENVTLTLSRTPRQGEVTSIPSPLQVEGDATYSFNNVQTYDTITGNAYTYQISQNKVSGYKTTINTYNVTNDLIVPTYTSNIAYTPIDTYKNLYLKNGKVKITANIQSTSGNTYPELGLNNGIVNFTIDSDINLDINTLKIYHTDNSGTKRQITRYVLNGNTLTVDFGENKISKSKDKIEIEVYGTLSEIKEYSSNISLTGNLRAYDGENTNINLGMLTTITRKNYSTLPNA